MNHEISAGLLQYLLDLTRRQKQIIQIAVDAFLITTSFVLSMWARFGDLHFTRDSHFWAAAATMVPVTIGVFTLLGLYSSVIRYIALEGARPILVGTTIGSLFLFLMLWSGYAPVPRSVPFTHALLATLLACSVRLWVRFLVGRAQAEEKEPVLIYGAGDAGRQLLNALRHGRTHKPVAFIDDALPLRGVQICGCRVHGPERLATLIERHAIATVLIAVPSASLTERKKILGRLEAFSVRVQTVPKMVDLLSGRAEVSQVREVAIEDLLGRSPVPPNPDLLARNIRDKVVMVTGAAGSIGSELCRQIVQQDPAILVLLEISEFGLYQIDMELRGLAAAQNRKVHIVPLLGSVGDRQRVETALRHFNVQTIYHAAAYKHVPLVEENSIQGLRNNVFGTRVLARAAHAAGVEVFVLISTDKAVRPTNVMGATKRIAELICQAEAAMSETTRFSMVRFGNVLGSSGSVIPRFRSQIAAGGPVTVTHPDINRYFMTIPEASQLVIQAGAMAHGGDVLVLDMGDPVRIVDLAARMINLYGLKPYLINDDLAVPGLDRDGDIGITFTGLRHGEKLYEELLIDAETRATDHPLIMSATEGALSTTHLEVLLRRLEAACDRCDLDGIRALLQSAPLGYRPSSAIVDLVSVDAGNDGMADVITIDAFTPNRLEQKQPIAA